MLEMMWRKGNTCTLFVAMQIGTATMKSSIEVSKKKTKNRTTISFSNPTTGHMSGENSNSKR